MEYIFEELGIPRKYLKATNKDDRYIALVHESWIKSLVKYSKLIDFIQKNRFETWPTTSAEIGPSWTRVFIRILKKRDIKVIPLPRIRNCSNIKKSDPSLTYCQLMQYISQSNYKNLWKEAYKKYNRSIEVKESQISLADYNDVLREIVTRTYGCPIINTCDSKLNVDSVNEFNPHLNILPSVCAVETLNAMFLIHIPFVEHNLNDCVNFSPALLDKCYTKPLFIVYQLLNTLKSLHDRSLTLGDITLSDINLNEDLWIYVFPQLSSNIYIQDTSDESKTRTIQDCMITGHKFDISSKKCEYCEMKTYDKYQVSNENLEKLCDLWINGQISNYTYLTALNNFSGRQFGDPNCHHVFPWVTDFASPGGKNWRDLKKSKYRLNKGDCQLDLTYDQSQTQVPHHVSDVLSSITYYVYKARRTPKSVLCKNVRTVWVPAEYPSSIQRMQEWTPDECIPEFFNDPSVFRSIHDDLGDLEVPPWATSPEDFVEKHREILESQHVSERLHHWIDLTFGYKLAGYAAVKAKNVCLPLADDHTYLTHSGIVQLFTQPHPARKVSSSFWGKIPPKIYVKTPRQKTRDRSCSSCAAGSSKSDEELYSDEVPSTSTPEKSPLAIAELLSRSRSSLNEDNSQKNSKVGATHRSASLGPKNATFTSHVITKPKSSLSVSSQSNCDFIQLPKEFKPDTALEYLERNHTFFSKTFHIEQHKYFSESSEDSFEEKTSSEDTCVQNAFTNLIFAESYEAKLHNAKAIKSLSFPLDNPRSLCQYQFKLKRFQKNESHIICNYSNIISSRRIRELQVLGCLIVEIFMAKELRALSRKNMTFSERLRNCLTVIRSCRNELPPSIRYIVNLLLQPSVTDGKNLTYPSVTDLGLPPPSAHLLLEPLLHNLIPFPTHFNSLYKLLTNLQDFKSVSDELETLYHFDCDGQMCAEFENLERTKILLAQNIGECKVKLFVRDLENLLTEINNTTDVEIINIILPHIKLLIEDPPSSILAAWYLFDPVARALGPAKTAEYLLDSVLKLYENEPAENTLPYYGKIAKLYHHSFLLRLMVRLGLQCFLDNFIAPLVEAVGGYKDYEKIDFFLHTHSEKIVKKMSHLKTMDDEQTDGTPSDDSSVCSEKQSTVPKMEMNLPEPEVFEFDDEKENENQLKSLIEHLELNISSDLPFNNSSAEEGLDATLLENIEQLKTMELDANSDYKECGPFTVPLSASGGRTELTNISCEIGSKECDADSPTEKKSIDSQRSNSFETKKMYSTSSSSSLNNKKLLKQDVKISDMSADSLVWLSHRLGPVLSARYLSRNLLKMLTLCYVGKENFVSLSREEIESDPLLIAHCKVIGDKNASKVLDCLTSIAGLYGEQLILFQYIPHMSELITLCKKKLTPNLEGGLISCLVLLKHIIPYLSDSTLMDQLQDVILKNIIHPTIRLLGSTKYTFPSGSIARNVLARKYIDAIYILSIRIGADMTRTHLMVPALQRFFLIFDKVHRNDNDSHINFENSLPEETQNSNKHIEESHYIEVMRDGTITEWAVGGKPIQISHVRVKDSESVDSLSPPVSLQTQTNLSDDSPISLALNELYSVFTNELAYTAYVPFLRHIGQITLEIALKNSESIKSLCQSYEEDIKLNYPNMAPKLDFVHFNKTPNVSNSGSFGSNISVIGNRIDIQTEHVDQPTDLLALVSSRVENNDRHLRGNWLAYWEHEIGRSDKDTMFNFKQIKLQTFSGHTHGVKCLYVLDSENSFMSGSRDKTVKLWSLRSQGDGSSVSSCQWTYTAHKKSILAITFIESKRLVASCDSIVHIWDPFLGDKICKLDSPKFAPVNVLKSMPAPSTLIFAATTEGTIKVIDCRLCKYIYELKINMNLTGLIRCLAISPTSTWIAAGHSSGNITVLDVRTGLVISTWRAHENEVLQLVPLDNNTLISSSLDQNISVWNIMDGKLQFHLKGAMEPAHCLNIYNNELISATTANRIGVHTSIDPDCSFSSTKLRSDTFRGLITSTALLPQNRLLLLGADSVVFTSSIMTQNPNASEKDDCNIRNSTAIPSHGTIPRWLKDITENIEENHKSASLSDEMSTSDGSDGPLHKLVNLSLNSSDVPTHIPFADRSRSENGVSTASNNTTKYGRRASLASQMYVTNMPRNIFISSADYLVPRLDDTFDFGTVNLDYQQQNLEKSWKTLNHFTQTHKERLDNAKSVKTIEQSLDSGKKAESHFSSESNSYSTYSLSFVDQPVPSRSSSVMSNYLPLYVYENIKKATENTVPKGLKLNKSKSSESITYPQKSSGATNNCNSDNNFFSKIEKAHKMYDPTLEKKLNDYRMKIMKENKLREQIISELLIENERNGENFGRRNSDGEKYSKTNSSEVFSNRCNLYGRNSKYKSRHGLRSDIFDSDYDSDNGAEDIDVFIMPELPSGKTLIIDILSTWGDKYYVGLNGIEIFSKSGELAKVEKCYVMQITAMPPDVNILPECKNDPRVVTNLLDGVNRTQDDLHIWLAPFDPGCSHIITIEFKEITYIAMIRIWNYNKSRIHSYRGVRDILMLLDGFPIFKGEIAKASGGIQGGINTLGDTILFTTDNEILENISKHDSSFESLISDPQTPVSVDRPLTSTRNPEGRPITGRINMDATSSPENEYDQILLGTRKIDMILLSNWGHSHLIGLTGLEITQGEEVITLNKNTITCNVERKPIFMNRLINGRNVTTDSKNMWSTIYRFGEEITITVDLQEFKYISGVRIWNYNENLEKSYAGVRTMKFFLDGKPLINHLTQDYTFLLRRAPGNEHYDFVQDIKFSAIPSREHIATPIPNKEQYSNMPEGFVFQFIVYSTWGDQYYCGLNGIELFDEYGRKLKLEEQNICAYPESVNVLPNIQDDIRTPDKLIDGINDDPNGMHSWVAPVIPKHLNRIYIVLDQPTTISYIKIWNYSKTPSRGIKDFGILVDDLLIYSGTLNKYVPNGSVYQTVLFTEDDHILGENHQVLKRRNNVVHDILLSNEEITSTTDGKSEEADPALRPFTSVNPFNKVFMSHSN